MITSDEQISSVSLLPICTLCTWVFYSTVSPWEFIYAKLRNYNIARVLALYNRYEQNLYLRTPVRK